MWSKLKEFADLKKIRENPKKIGGKVRKPNGILEKKTTISYLRNKKPSNFVASLTKKISIKIGIKHAKIKKLKSIVQQKTQSRV